MRVVFVDDDPASRDQWMELATGEPWLRAEAVESVGEANGKTGTDVYVIDISAASPSLFEMAYAHSPIIKLIGEHPGTIMVIVSAVGEGYAESLLDDIEEVTGTRPLYGGWGKWEDLLPVLQALEE